MVDPRREFSARTKRLAWERANGFCEGQIIFEQYFVPGGIKTHYTRCRAPIDLGNFHYDHINPDWYSKDDELSNCQVLCRECHKAKTKNDIKKIAKTKRLIKGKRKKRGGFKGWRKFDGTVVHVKR